MCQPHVCRSKLQETSGGEEESAPPPGLPSIPPEAWEAGRRALGWVSGVPKVVGVEWGWGWDLCLSWWPRRGCSPSGSRCPPRRPAGQGPPSPQGRQTPASWGHGGELLGPGSSMAPPTWLNPHLERPVALPQEDCVRLPGAAAVPGFPHQLPGTALHHQQRQEACPRGHQVSCLPPSCRAPPCRAHLPAPPLRAGQRPQGRQVSSTLGVALQKVSHVELTVGA